MNDFEKDPLYQLAMQPKSSGGGGGGDPTGTKVINVNKNGVSNHDVAGYAAAEVHTDVPGPTGTTVIRANGTHDVTEFAAAEVQVPQEAGEAPTIGENGNWYINGQDTGKPSRGAQGDPGNDGTSPTVETAAIEGGHRVTMTDKTGPHAFDVMDGRQGDPGNDGTSPTVKTEAIDGGNRVTITDATGAHSFDVMDGKDGAGGGGSGGGDYAIVKIAAEEYQFDKSNSKVYNLKTGESSAPSNNWLKLFTHWNDTDYIIPVPAAGGAFETTLPVHVGVRDSRAKDSFLWFDTVVRFYYSNGAKAYRFAFENTSGTTVLANGDPAMVFLDTQITVNVTTPARAMAMTSTGETEPKPVHAPVYRVSPAIKKAEKPTIGGDLTIGG